MIDARVHGYGEGLQVRVGKDLLYARLASADIGIERVNVRCNAPGPVFRPPDVWRLAPSTPSALSILVMVKRHDAAQRTTEYQVLPPAWTWNFQLGCSFEIAVIKESIAVPKAEIAAFKCGCGPLEDTHQYSTFFFWRVSIKRDLTPRRCFVQPWVELCDSIEAHLWMRDFSVPRRNGGPAHPFPVVVRFLTFGRVKDPCVRFEPLRDYRSY